MEQQKQQQEEEPSGDACVLCKFCTHAALVVEARRSSLLPLRARLAELLSLLQHVPLAVACAGSAEEPAAVVLASLRVVAAQALGCCGCVRRAARLEHRCAERSDATTTKKKKKRRRRGNAYD